MNEYVFFGKLGIPVWDFYKERLLKHGFDKKLDDGYSLIAYTQPLCDRFDITVNEDAESNETHFHWFHPFNGDIDYGTYVIKTNLMIKIASPSLESVVKTAHINSVRDFKSHTFHSISDIDWWVNSSNLFKDTNDKVIEILNDYELTPPRFDMVSYILVRVVLKNHKTRGVRNIGHFIIPKFDEYC